MPAPLPAHATKALPVLIYPLPAPIAASLRLSQLASDPTVAASTITGTTGTTLWLSSQILSLYLLTLPPPSPSFRPRAIDLGAGTGLTSLVLGCLGYDVLSTDIPAVISSVLSPNVSDAYNSSLVARSRGSVTVSPLDWNIETGGEGEWDLVVTADTVYKHELMLPLVRTIARLVGGRRKVMVLVALEVRDVQVVEYALDCARDAGFEVRRVPKGKIVKAMVAGSLEWEQEEWDGCEIWRWVWKGKKSQMGAHTEQGVGQPETAI